MSRHYLMAIAGILTVTVWSVEGRTVYIRDGVSDWTSGASYYGGEAPAAGDIVVVSNKTEVTVSGADAETCALVSSLGGIRPMYSQSRVVFDIPVGDPVTINAPIYNPEGSVNGFWGELVKRGAGELVLGSYDRHVSGSYVYDYKVGTITVEEGVLTCPQNVPKSEQQYGNIHVAGGAKLVLSVFDTSRGSSALGYYINGTLTGAGTVENPIAASRQLRVYKNCEFAGRFVGQVELFLCGEVDLTGEESTTPLTPMVWSLAAPATPGCIGVKKFGLSGEPSSLGQNGTFAIDYRGGGYRYLGTGETTDKALKIAAQTVNPAVMDGGPFGGITFTGSWYMNNSPAQMHELVLRGSNTTACVLENKLLAWTKNDVAYDFQIVKEGSGIWRFNEVAGQTWAGALYVRDGVVQFDSLKEAGENCALGLATNCMLAYMGEYDAAKRVNYAISLGSADGYPTLEYVGGAAGQSTTRKLHLAGRGGRLASSAAELAFAGVETESAAKTTLTLDADWGVTHYLKDVNEGDGEISLVKTGLGKWILDGNLNLSGGIAVSNGTLEVRHSDQQYTWYRFTVKRVSGGGQYFNTVEMAFYDAEGHQVFLSPKRIDTESLNVWQWSDGNYRALQPGEVCYGRTGWYKNMSYGTSDVRDLRQAFNGWASNGQPSTEIYYGGDGEMAVAKGIDPTNPSSWIVFVLRLPANCPKVIAYDMMCSSDYGRQWRPSHFMLEGSRDGVYWTTLHSVSGSGADNSTGAYQWMSDGTMTTGTGTSPAVRPNTGWAIASESMTPETQVLQLGCVTISGAGKLEVSSGATVNALALDTKSAGSCSGLTFAQAGTLTVSGDLVSGEQILGTRFENCTNLANLTNWTVLRNGQPIPRTIKVVNNRVYLCPKSLIFILY